MAGYMPLLKARLGEFQAYGRLSAPTIGGVLPLFEWCPDADPTKAVEKPVRDAQRWLQPGSRVAIDLRSAGSDLAHAGSRLTPEVWAAQQLRSSGIEAVPVVRTSDAPATWAALEPIVGSMPVPEVVLRIDQTTHWSPADAAVVARALGLPLEQIHLLVDFGAVSDASAVAVAAPKADSLIRWSSTFGKWASITLASGAFPASISNLPPSTANLIARWDADLWRRVTALGHTISFGDYAVNSTAMPAANARGPLPNLRYTLDHSWLVWREPKTPIGNTAFFSVAARVAAHPGFSGPTFSWGDGEIDRCSRGEGGAGTATQWRAYGTSHHITQVVDRLANLGEP